MATTTFDISRANQNQGLVDRILRVLIGFSMLGGGAAYVSVGEGFASFATLEPSVLMLMLASVYPILTGAIGWDPVYHLLGIRTCSDSGKNACGTLPFQVAAVLGKEPKYCEPNDQHSLEGCHDNPEPLPKHNLWKVEQSPMLSPSDADMDRFAAREKRLKL